MAITDLFIRRPVLSIVLSCLLLMLGLQAGVQLQIRQFPDVDKSLVVVETVYPGASARTVKGFVTEPLQRRIASAEGVDYMTSRSDPGMSRIEVHARLGEDADQVMTSLIA
ncbi:MAG: efflux RND transporter permease subunit, partial [Gammaproteobacteria bacterium]